VKIRTRRLWKAGVRIRRPCQKEELVHGVHYWENVIGDIIGGTRAAGR